MSAESEHLSGAIQLTFPERFARAGEAYFSADMTRIIFQAIDAPAPGEQPAEIYTMYVADLLREGDEIRGLGTITRVSPAGSANTCGWFDPHDSTTIYFASTIAPPSNDEDVPGYQRGSGRYKWSFPREMQIVRCDLDDPALGTAAALSTVAGKGEHYHAEGALSPDGRHLVYSSLATGGGDVHVLDLTTGRDVHITTAPGYDGGPFFSPDGRRLCYRSDRAENDLLQIYVAELRFDDEGGVLGLQREFQLTRNEHVNWGPFWHPSGTFLIYATSEMGHHNYEIFGVDADAGDGTTAHPARYGSRRWRITHAPGADVLPVFSPDGKYMMWAGQRGPDRKSQIWAARFSIDAATPAPAAP